MITPSITFRTLSIVTTLMLSGAAFAHDFWLSPDTYQVPPEATLAEAAFPESAILEPTINVSVMIGHPEEETHWPVTPHRVIALRSFSAGGVTDHQSAIADYTRNKALPIRLTSPGTHVLSIETTHAVSELEAERFNAYVRDEGLRPIAIDRARKGTQDTPGREIYSRRGKVILDVGDGVSLDMVTVTQPLGLTLEVVPLAHPATLAAEQALSADILYRGQKLGGATVRLVSLDGDTGTVATGTSDAMGRIAFDHPGAGRWMLHTIWSDPLETEEADFDTVFSSLSFAIR